MSTQLALTAGAAAVLLLAQSTGSPVILAQSTGSPVVAVVPHAHTGVARPTQVPRCPPRVIPPTPTDWARLPHPGACHLLVTRARARALERDPLR
jgi:hypothetical protein